jgi:hypothetical protein
MLPAQEWLGRNVMNGQVRAGWLYWVITVVGLLWNAFGGFDYYMTQSRNADYLANFPPEVIAFVEAMPAWVQAAWAIGVWFSVIGSVLMLIRSRWAVPAFALSLAGLAASNAYQWIVGMPPSMTQPAMLAITGMIWVILIFLLWYTNRARARGILR